jgi:hypothetical protein
MKLLKKQSSKLLDSKTKKANRRQIVQKEDDIKTHKYFLPHARLNRGQRRYCHCLMKSRKGMGQPYSFCNSIARKDWAKGKRNKSQAKQYYFDIMKTNCVMNYDYNDYSLEEVQAFATEKNIPLFTTTTTSTGTKKKYHTKDKLVQLLVQNYLNKHKSKKMSRKIK